MQKQNSITKKLKPAPKTQAGRRHLEKRQPKEVENNKMTLLCGTQSASRMCQEFMRDLFALKGPLCQRIHSQVDNPINDKQLIQSLSQKCDASLFVHVSHTKKRPDNLVFGRMFNYELAEQYEFQLKTFVSLQDIPSKKPMPQCKPMLVFQGDGFQNDDDMRKIKSVFIDIFKGKNYPKFNRDALQWCICFTTNANSDEIKVRSYVLNDVDNTEMKNVESPTHITPMGFQFELIRRRRECNAKAMKEALIFGEAKKRKDGESTNAAKIEKGITTDEIGRKFATVHVGAGDTAKLNLRKFKGLNEKYDLSDEEYAEDMEEFEEEDEQ